MDKKEKTSPDFKREHPVEKTRLHPRNQHRERYDFKLLMAKCADLKPLVVTNKYGDDTVDFSNPEAVRVLNKALLMQYYNVSKWDIPKGYLCPPVPGRADYIHNAADLLAQKNFGKVPVGSDIICLDIGVGASCIYPIIGVREYGWSFIGSDIDKKSLASAQKIIDANTHLQDKVKLHLQPNEGDILKNIIQQGESIDIVICNPPFHASAEEAATGSIRKIKNLTQNKNATMELNFGGQSHELWCEGGEEAFVKELIIESKQYRDVCFWFTTLISKQSNLKRAIQALEKAGVQESRTIAMGQGHKASRILAWTYLNPNTQKEWAQNRWSQAKI